MSIKNHYLSTFVRLKKRFSRQLFLLNPWKTSTKLSIKDTDSSKVVAVTLLKSFSLMQTFFRMQIEFRNDFFKKHLQHTTPVASQKMEIRGFNLEPPEVVETTCFIFLFPFSFGDFDISCNSPNPFCDADLP